MKATYHIHFGGEIDLDAVDEKTGIESISDLEKVINESFKPDLLAGVTIDSKDINIRYNP